MLYYEKVEREAAYRLREILARPQMPDDLAACGAAEGEFDPWDIFPCLYGTYDSAFDALAIAVLIEVQNGRRVREDLAADMFREMLCTANLCTYGTSPRVCFATPHFKELLPDLIEKWQRFSALSWSDALPE